MFKLTAMLVASAATAAAAAATPSATSSSDTLVASAAWWEKVTVTLDGNGQPESCRYETSTGAGNSDCDVDSGPAAMVKHASASKGDITRITFERRFTPGADPKQASLQIGDTLLGGQVMSLAIDPHGAVKGCQVVAASGSMKPDYSCDDAQAEKFQASVGAVQPDIHQGYMTILVYGHSEHMV